MAVPPDDFADALARVLEPRDRATAAEIIQDATTLDDERLAVFLRLFGDRVRESGEAVRADELRAMLATARRA